MGLKRYYICDICTEAIRGMCACDAVPGSIREDCWICAPKKHERPPCRRSCANYKKTKWNWLNAN